MCIWNGGAVVEMRRAILGILSIFVEKSKECLMGATDIPRTRVPDSRIGTLQPEGLNPATAFVK